MSSSSEESPAAAASAEAGLWDRLVGRAGTFRTSLHCWVGSDYAGAPWRDVVRDAERMTAGLRRLGVRRGGRVAAVLTNGPSAVRGLLGVWLAGGAVASLPLPARGMAAEEYAQQLTAICARLGTPVLLTEQGMVEALPESLRAAVPVRSWQSVADSGAVAADPPGEDEAAFVQYSSGSTSMPKGCVITPRAIAAQVALLQERIAPRSGSDRTAAWLPLSHDMGMFGCLLTSWLSDMDLYLSTPERFMFAPGTWFSDMAKTGATLTAGTPTALYLAARAARRLSRISDRLRTRVCIVGAERVEWDTLRFAVDALGPHGLREEALMPAYGLAEATLAVTATPREEVPRRITVDATALAGGTLTEADPDDPAATDVVSAGTPCRGVTLVAPADGGDLGEIRLRSPSLARGYHADEALTAERFHDGVLSTGDLGFVRDGHLYPVGRTDDMISVAGRKVYAREIEGAIDGIDGLRHGCAALLGEHHRTGTRLTLLLEARGVGDYRALAEQAAAVAMAKGAVALDECVFLERNALPRTPSGKIQRHRCRQLLACGRLPVLATVALAAR